MELKRILYIRNPIKGMNVLVNASAVQQFVENYMYVSGGRYKIGDLSLLSDVAISTLLKFVEESDSVIEAYASSDNLPPVIMSRFQQIIKSVPCKAGFGGFQSVINDVEELTPRLVYENAATSLHKYHAYLKLPSFVRDKVIKHI